MFRKYNNNPIITPDFNLDHEKECTYNPCATVGDGGTTPFIEKVENNIVTSDCRSGDAGLTVSQITKINLEDNSYTVYEAVVTDSGFN